MNLLFLEGSSKTPTIELNAGSGVFRIEGRSIPENSSDFYKPVILWLDQYITNPQELTQVNVRLEYFNTSSSKCILDLFKRLEILHKRGHKVIINWYYEEDDEDMLEAGEDYQSIIRVPISMVEIED